MTRALPEQRGWMPSGTLARGVYRQARVALVAIAAALVVAIAPARAAQFSFLTKPTDQLGVPGYLPGTDVTPEGSLYTGWTELAFRFGQHLRPSYGTDRELLDGRFQVIRYFMHAGAVQYEVTVFAAAVANEPVNFIRVSIANRSRRPALAAWSSGLLYAGGRLLPNGQHAFRFSRPAIPPREGDYTQPGSSFDPRSTWAFDRDTVVRDGTVLLVFPRAPGGFSRRLTARPGGSRGAVSERTVFGQVEYRGRLAPGAHAALDLTMPVVPPPDGSAQAATVVAARFEPELRRELRYWRAVYARAIRIEVPEPKVVNAFYSSLAAMLVARWPAASGGPAAGGWVQAVNKLQYNASWLRDGAIIANALDLAGLHGAAAQDLEFFPSWQQPDGLFISRPQQYDGFGEALWAICQHAVLTGDRVFATQMLGAVQRAMAWFEQDRSTESWGLMPASTPGDDELTSGHITGDDFWAADGVQSAIAMAGLLGRADLVTQWTRDLGGFMNDLRGRLHSAEAKTGGWIPPALEDDGGQDWGNLWPSYPMQVLPANDPSVTATLRHVLARFREGIATYYDGLVLHDYLGFRVFETELLRGEQRAVVHGLYSELAHTTSTNAGFELGVRRHGARWLDFDLAPHGTFAAEYVALLRNMLVREDGTTVFLMSAVSPAWLRPGERIAVGGADTSRGTISFTLRSVRGGAILRWRARLTPGTALVWPVPAAARHVRAKGLRGETITLHPGAGRLRVRWQLVGAVPSFAATAAWVLRQYRR